MAADWQPMTAAPRDGTRILGWFGDRCIVVFWRSGKKYANCRAIGETSFWSSGYNRHSEPDCWMPEPTGPLAGSA